MKDVYADGSVPLQVVCLKGDGGLGSPACAEAGSASAGTTKEAGTKPLKLRRYLRRELQEPPEEKKIQARDGAKWEQ